jgi:hypothetical protein
MLVQTSRGNREETFSAYPRPVRALEEEHGVDDLACGFFLSDRRPFRLGEIAQPGVLS